MLPILHRLVWMLPLLLSWSVGRGSDIASSDRVFFENRIRPVLAQSCYECHSATAEKLGGKLLLDSREGIRTGGESGTALIPGDPEESLLIHALQWEHDLEMPPEQPLTPAVIADFEEWIRRGAPDPRSGKKSEVAGKSYDEGALWSFQPLVQDPSFSTKDSRFIDLLIERQWEESQLTATPRATARELIHRLHFDLTGLPPQYGEVVEFEKAFSAEPETALTVLVDHLLDSPHFGERWGRHWLDVARFAESNGNDGLSRNAAFPHAWRYRDYVIAAFNEDLPFDRFLLEQVAGDLLPADTPEQRDRQLIATGLFAIGAKPAKAMNNNFDMDIVADQVDVIGSGFLGVSIACARCHDHKFDPITARDYYALAGMFTSSETLYGLAGNEKLTAPPTDLHVLKTAEFTPPPADFVETVILKESATGKPKKIPAPKWKPGTPLAMGLRDRKEPADAKLNIKGDAKKLGDPVPRGIPAIYQEKEKPSAFSIPEGKSGRLALAKWMADPEHPQTARVYVNRVWMHLFGRGLVDTPNDFGVYGARPTHPELLDHLALHFIDQGWSTKKLIRSIVLSDAYQRTSRVPDSLLEQDEENLWLTRQNRRRLDAESLRDRMLAASGLLERNPGEGSLIQHRDILVNLAGNLHEPSRHRSIYLCYLRNSPPPELAAFDLPSFLKPVAKREASTRPGQGLYLFNHPFVFTQSEAIAENVLKLESDEEQITRVFREVFLRDPDPEELYRGKELLQSIEDPDRPERAWVAFAQSLLTSNEFRYID